MGLSVKQGVFNIGAGTGTTAVTGVGFTPKLVILFSRGSTGTGLSANARMSIGAMCTGGLQGSNTYRAVDAQGAEESSRIYRTGKVCYFAIEGSGAAAVNISIGYSSLDADGFTVDTTTNTTSTAIQIGYLALGGTDITDVTIGHVTLPALASKTTVNTLGHNLSGLILMSTLQVEGDNTHVADGELLMGFSDGTNQAVCGVRSNSTTDPSIVSRTISNSYVMAKITADADTRDGSSTVKFITGGFELTHEYNYVVDNHIMYIAINGPHFKVGNTTMPGTATTDFSVTGIGFQPLALLQMNAATIDTDGTDGTFSQLWLNVGMATGSAAQFECGIEGEDNVGTSNANRFSNSAKFIQRNNHGTTSQITAVVKSFDSDGFTLTQDLASSSDKLRIFYLAIGAQNSHFLLREQNELYVSNFRGINLF